MAAMLGTIKAGAAYVALDPHYPRPYLQHIIRTAEPTLVLMTGGEANWLKNDSHSKDICVDLEEGQLQAELALCSNERGVPHEPEVSSSLSLVAANLSVQLLYVLYTSGSTGVPKGVKGTHLGALNRISWNNRDPSLEPGMSSHCPAQPVSHGMQLHGSRIRPA